MHCHECKKDVLGIWKYCPYCGSNQGYIPPVASQQGDVAVIDWLDEWRAALRQLETAIDKTATAQLDKVDWNRASVALMAIEKIVDPKRATASQGKTQEMVG